MCLLVTGKSNAIRAAFLNTPGLIEDVYASNSDGLGIMYAQGEEEWELGYGGPAVLSMSLGYELRLSRSRFLCPTVSLMWVTKNDEDFDSLTLFFGFEFVRWFQTATG